MNNSVNDINEVSSKINKPGSYPVFAGLVKFSGRRNRLSYFLLTLFIWSFLAPIVAVIFLALNDGNQEAEAALLLVAFVIVWVPINLLTTAQRFRDINWTGWSYLLLTIPIVNLAVYFFLIFVPGTVGPNRYGEDPLAPKP